MMFNQLARSFFYINTQYISYHQSAEREMRQMDIVEYDLNEIAVLTDVQMYITMWCDGLKKRYCEYNVFLDPLSHHNNK